MRAPTLPLVALLPAALLAGCAEDFTPASVLDSTRILAVTASPLEAGPGDEVTVGALVVAHPDDPVTSTEWTFCPLTTGAQGGFRCVLEACETSVPASLTVDPYALAEACVAAAGGAVPGGGAGVPVEVESVFRLRVQTGPRASRGAPPLEAVLRLPLSTAPPAVRNRAPAFARVEIGGVPAVRDTLAGSLPPGGRIDVAAELTPESREPYVDASGRTILESVVVSFFTTAGRFADERGEAPRATTVLEGEELPAGAAQAEVWVVARDLRGGQAWDGPFRIAIAR